MSGQPRSNAVNARADRPYGDTNHLGNLLVAQPIPHVKKKRLEVFGIHSQEGLPQEEQVFSGSDHLNSQVSWIVAEGRIETRQAFVGSGLSDHLADIVAHYVPGYPIQPWTCINVGVVVAN